MKKRLLSLGLALCLCVGLAAPALATTGETKTATVTCEGVEFIEDISFSCPGEAATATIELTATNVLRTVSGIYPVSAYNYEKGEMDIFPRYMTLYVVGDEGTTITGKILGDGATFANRDWIWGLLSNGADWDVEREQIFGGAGSGGTVFGYGNEFDVGAAGPYGSDVRAITDEIRGFDGYFICESAFKKLVPYEGALKCSNWAAPTMKAAVENRLIPNDYYFNPYVDDMSRPMTRQEFAAVALQLFDVMGGILPMGTQERDSYYEGEHFEDVYDENVEMAYLLKIVDGTGDTTFSPDETLTREQAATMLSRVWTALGKTVPAATTTTFADNAAISGWAKTGVAFLASNGIVDGMGDNKFEPRKNLSIQEAMTMAERMLEKLK